MFPLSSRLLSALLFALTLLPFPTIAAAISLQVLSTQADPGSNAEMCIALAGNSQASALQFDLQWDESCVTPILSGGNPQCAASPATGKSALTRLHGASARVILLSMSDQTPITNGVIACCDFSVSTSPSSSTCGFALTNVSAADGTPKGVSSIATQGGVLAIRRDTGSTSPRSGGLPSAPVAGGGISIPGANQGGTSAPEPTAAKNDPAPTSAGPALGAVSRVTPQPNEQELAPAIAADGAQRDSEMQLHDRQHGEASEGTPTVAVMQATARTTPTASTPTARSESTRTAPLGTATPQRTATASTPTPAKQK